MLLAVARDDAQMVLSADPHLVSPRGRRLRHLLYLFECDEAVRLFRAAGFADWGTLPRVAEHDGVERDLVVLGQRL